MRVFRHTYEEEFKCPGCNWGTTTFFTLADTEEEAREIFGEFEEAMIEGDELPLMSPLCGECMADVLVEGGHIITKEVKNANLGS